MQPVIVVSGSLNMDFVVTTTRLPVPGETVLGYDFRTLPGGKGANQACAAGRLAKHLIVRMAGRVGCDVFAEQLRASLTASNVDVSAVLTTPSFPTGVALIEVDSQGQNTIVVASGANFEFQPGDIATIKLSFEGAKCALFQLETPPETVRAGVLEARRQGAFTILDPAPAQCLPRNFLEQFDLITPNESEACLLLERPEGSVSVSTAAECAAALLGLGARAVLLKLGEAGCIYVDQEKQLRSEGFRVTAVDTTAAGDTFNGALAVALTEGRDFPSAMRFANAAAAISVTRAGAQTSIPTRAEVDRLLAETIDQPLTV